MLVPVDGPPEVVYLAGGGDFGLARSLTVLIGAECVKRIELTDRWEFWLDEDAVASGKAVSQAATRVARDFRGPMSATSSNDEQFVTPPGSPGSARYFTSRQ